MAAPGETALDFLNLPPCAVSAAMGRGGYAFITGPDAVFGNPAMLGRSTALSASHQELLLDTRADAIAAGIGLGRGWSVGLAAIVFSAGYIQGYSEGNLKTNSIDAGDRLLKFALAYDGRVAIGLSVSSYYQALADRTARGIGFGGGVAAETGPGRLALTADNIGPRFGSGGTSAPLPTRTSLSGWLPLHSGMFETTIDIVFKWSDGFGGALGVQYMPLDGFALRAGSNTADPLTFGFRLGAGRFSVDYSYMPISEFGDKHIIGILLAK